MGVTPDTPPTIIDDVLSRFCTSCRSWKPATAEFFQPQKGCRMGLRPTCRDCMRSRSRAYAEQNSSAAVARATEWNRRNRDRHRQILRAVKINRRKAPGSIKATDIAAALERQGTVCFYCSQSVSDRYEVDHFIALSKGGSNSAENIVIACRRCNRAKGSKDPAAFKEQLKRQIEQAAVGGNTRKRRVR